MTGKRFETIRSPIVYYYCVTISHLVTVTDTKTSNYCYLFDDMTIDEIMTQIR